MQFSIAILTYPEGNHQRGSAHLCSVQRCKRVTELQSNTSNMDWLVVEPTPLKNLKVNWDDDIPNIWKIKSHVPHHQPVENLCETKQIQISSNARIVPRTSSHEPRVKHVVMPNTIDKSQTLLVLLYISTQCTAPLV